MSDMRNLRRRLAPLLLLPLLIFAGGLDASDRRPDFSTWFDDAGGMLEAVERHKAEEQPILVYFYTDWCPYCRQLERELLSEDYVENYLHNILKVRINPENGPREAQISQQYGVRGYPALFMHSGRSRVLSVVQRLEVVDGEPRLLSAEEFVDQLREAAAR